jgi:hypothetical protein
MIPTDARTDRECPGRTSNLGWGYYHGSGIFIGYLELEWEDRDGVKGILLQKCRDVGRRGGSGKMVVE